MIIILYLINHLLEKVYTSSDNLNFLNSHYTVNLTLIKKLNILNSDLILKD